MKTEILSNLKCRILDLYETFTSDDIDSFKIGQIRLTIYRLRPLSDAGKLQLEILIKFFNEDVLSRFQQKWDKEKLIWRKANIESAFDIIMQMGYVAG
ncbi:MAG TPA: hypothetical protein DCR39_06540 [Nitrospiraceae bacterium]|nr:hypothetical protein [Nitrospiraceae bacterium]